MARSSRGGGSGSRRSRTYWMCSCGGLNWDWRTTCLGCGHAAPPWALESAAAKAKPQADKDGWVDPPGSGATAIERLQAAAEQLEALQAEPPDGVDSCFTGVVASQLEAKRAELVVAQRAAAEQKAPSLPLSTQLHKEANAISKAEKRLRAARQGLEQKQAARDLAEAQLQKAQGELALLDAEVEEASRAPHVLEEAAREEAEAQQRQRAAEWAGASQVPGLLVQLDKLHEAWGSSNFEVARVAIRTQVEAARAQLAEAPAAPRRAPWAESCPMGEISSEDGDRAGSSGPWQPQCAAERGQAERRGDALGEWPKVARACKRELAAEAADLAPLVARPAGRAAGGRVGGQAATAAQDVRCGLEVLGINGNTWRRSREVIEAFVSRHGAPPHLVILQETRLAPHRLEEARGAVRRTGYTAFPHASAPTDKEGPPAHSGGVAALVRSDRQAKELAWQFTCVDQGAEHEYDWFASSFCLAHGAREASALDGFGLCPHKPARLLLQDARPDALVQVLVRPGRSPDVDAAACRLREDAAVQARRRAGRTRWQVEPCRWSWEVGPRPSAPHEAARQWIQVVESTLVGIHGIDDGDLHRYLGRSEGPKIVLKPLSAVVKCEYRHRHSALTHAIRQALDIALQRLTADRKQRWQPAHEAWHARQVERALADAEAAAAAACEEDEVEALEYDTSEWGDLIGQAGVHGSPEAIAVLQQRLAGPQRRDGGKSSASRRAWAKDAVQKGGRLAQRFAEAVPPPQVVDPAPGRPLAGMLAAGQLEANWQALWQQEGFRSGAGVGSWDVRGWALPPLSLEMLQAVCNLFLDIAKFYENLRHDVLWQCGIEHGFNLKLLRGLLMLYQSPRFICFVGLATESFCTNGTVFAGCACATTVAKLPVLAALRAASVGGRPLAVARNVVDDVALQAVGTERLVAAQLGSAGLEVARFLRGQHLPLSAAKTTFLASSPSLGRQLGEHCKSQGWSFRKTLQARNLGTDAAITRRGVHEGRVRAAGALRRARRLGCLRAAGAEVDLIHRAGPTASMARGRAVTGIADGELRSWRLAARRSAALCPPIDAVALTLARIGWHFQPERCLVTDLGDELDLMLLGPRELGLEAGLGARRASDRREMRQLSHDPLMQRPLYWDAIGRLLGPDSELSARDQSALGAYISNAHWTQAMLLDAGERGHARCNCCGAERGTLWHRLFECPVLEPQRRDGVSARLKRCAERARAAYLRPADEKLNGKLYLDGSALEPQFGALRRAGWAIAQCDDDGNLVAGVHGTVRRDLCPQQTAKDGEDFAVWMLANFAGPAVEEVNIDGSATVTCLRRGRAYSTAPSRANAHLRSRVLAAFEPGTFEVKKVPAHCSRQAVLDGLLTEAQRRGDEHADRLAKMGAQMHAVDRQTVGEHHALAEIVRELGRWICRAANIWQGIAVKDCEGLPPAAERRQVRFAAAEASQAAEEAAGAGPLAKRPRLESARSTGSSSAALSASAVAFSILGHAFSYACAGEGEDTQEIVACSKRGAYMVLGGRSGVKPRFKERCPGDKADKSGRNQRSLWLRGLHPEGRPRAARQRAKGEGIPALRSQGPVPGHAQERYLEWLGIAAEPAVGASSAASSAGSAPAAAAAPEAASGSLGEAPAPAPAAAAAASQPLQRPAATRAGFLGAFRITEEELSAAASAAVDALQDRRVRRRLARRGDPSESE
ncbi:unnamed protein product [Prorocentrum cordatum]|uniref:Uncharacterized protein n=1 Tax=Prorocentrum cordatum TaxID=2364126 RepID=A0ABN9U540_9DINO|nr:unnamed protein product [Polarella glacialis]